MWCLNLMTKFQIVHEFVYLIYEGNCCIVQMIFQINFDLLQKKIPSTVWIGLGIGESTTRGKGAGMIVMEYLKKQIYTEKLKANCIRCFCF